MILHPPLAVREKLFGNLDMDHKERNDRHSPREENKSRDIDFSLFVHLFQDRELSVSYNSLTLKRIYGDSTISQIHKILCDEEDIEERIKERCGPEAYEILQDSDFLTPFSYRPKALPEVLYLFVTNKCNLRCTYCINTIMDQDMSFSTARKAIDFFLPGAASKKKTIIFCGGEPLLNWETVNSVLDYLGKREDISFVLPTNGILLTRSRIKALKKHNVEVWFAIDGEKRHHDRMRINSYGQGSHEDTLRGYNLYKKEARMSNIFCKISAHNRRDIERIVNYLCHELEVRKLCFDILRVKDINNPYPVTISEFTSSFLKGFELLRSIGIPENYMLRKLMAFIYEEPVVHMCRDSAQKLAVTPDGSIGACHDLIQRGINIIGHVDNLSFCDNISDSTDCKISDLQKECISCQSLGICGGRCATDSQEKENSGNYLCEFNKLLIKYLIMEEFKEIRKLENSGKSSIWAK